MTLRKTTNTGNITGKISTTTKNISATISSGGGVSDHNRLFNRDAENQHPISAITQ